MPEFVKDVEQIRQRALRNIEEGAVTEAYQLDKDRTVEILNEALATEIVCVLRYMHHYFMATGVHAKSISDEFKEHADAEREHADQIAERIQQLGGKPDFNPRSLLERSVSQYVEGENLAEMIREDLIAERIVIEVYSDMIRYFGDKDPTTRLMLEHILKDEEEHASELADLLYIVEPSTGETQGEDPGTRPLRIQGQQGRGEPGRSGQQARGREPQREQPRGDREPVRTASGQDRERAQTGAGGSALRGEADRERRSGAAEPFAGRGGASPGPGTTGHPTRQRPQQVTETEAEKADEGAQGGGTRAVRVTKPNRKKRVA